MTDMTVAADTSAVPKKEPARPADGAGPGCATARGAPARTAPDRLFTTRSGAVYRHDYYGTRIFAAAVARAGLPAGTTSHDLRHHYASALLAAGESVVAVAERLGHDNAALVLSTSGPLMPDSEDRTRRAIDTLWAGAATEHFGDRNPQATTTASL